MTSFADLLSDSSLEISVVTLADSASTQFESIERLEPDALVAVLRPHTMVLCTGRGLGVRSPSQREFIRRLAANQVSVLLLGLGEYLDFVPEALVREANQVGIVVAVVPSVGHLEAIRQVVDPADRVDREQLLRALHMQEQASAAAIDGGLERLLIVAGQELECSLRVVVAQTVVIETHERGRRDFGGETESVLEVAIDHETTLQAARSPEPFDSSDQVVLRSLQYPVAMQLARERAVHATELRLAGDLLAEIEAGRLREGDIEDRLSAFGFEHLTRFTPAMVQVHRQRPELVLELLTSALRRVGIVHFLTGRTRELLAILIPGPVEDKVRTVAAELHAAGMIERVAIGRVSSGDELGRSLLECRAVIAGGGGPVGSYRDLGPMGMLLNVPRPLLHAYVQRVLGPVAQNGWLIEALTGLLDSGMAWKSAAFSLGIHRHTLRYRIDRLAEQTGRHPDEPADRLELWLAVRALEALAVLDGGSIADDRH